MHSNLNRRELIETVAGTALLPAQASAAETAPASDQVPKICLGIGRNLINEAGMRRVKQLGVDYVLMGGPRIPWREDEIRPMIDTLKAGGLTLGNMMIAGFPNTIYGKPGRDEEIEKIKESIQVAGKVGLPVIEYNFYAHRAMEGPFVRRASSTRTSRCFTLPARRQHRGAARILLDTRYVAPHQLLHQKALHDVP